MKRGKTMYDNDGTINFRKVFSVGITVVLLFVVLVLSFKLFENVDADEILVVQDPVDGDLHWYINPGIKWQWIGKTTKYLKRDIYLIQEARVRFNDAGHGTIRGSVQYDMPLDSDNLTKLHTRYGSPEAIKDQVIKRTVDKVIYMTGPLMSSRESYAEKRTNLINYVQDQIDLGVYKVQQRESETVDQISGQKKSLIIAEVVIGKDGKEARQERSIVGEFGIKAFNFAIEELKYSDTVEKQIQQQQQITMDVQTAIAEARKAEQRKLTVEQQGAANAAKAKWDQEVIKAREVTAAEQRLRVAELDRQAAEQTKRKLILEGEGEATKRQLIMSADGALEKKLDYWLKGQQVWAGAVKDYQGNWVPSVVMGGSTQSGRAGSGAQDLVDLLTIKTAKELSLDFAIPKK